MPLNSTDVNFPRIVLEKLLRSAAKPAIDRRDAVPERALPFKGNPRAKSGKVPLAVANRWCSLGLFASEVDDVSASIWSLFLTIISLFGFDFFLAILGSSEPLRSHRGLSIPSPDRLLEPGVSPLPPHCKSSTQLPLLSLAQFRAQNKSSVRSTETQTKADP
ncbi:hypothetical protein B0H16DRAFT_1468637 [Mycena metata]|uniref:Uncharacterized protein n=1 Tax=Mycena metata TaxID=1033252 RepID=A0AAD7I086_9AGAR|nr:hypothetical protein B0H16DRAFT_1468637 [Mycena metata]